MKEAHSLQAGFPVSNDCKPDDINKTYAMPPQSHKSLFGGCRWLGLQLRQGFETLHIAVAMTVIHGFFVPCSQFSMGRGGISAIKNPLWERLMRRFFVTVSNTPTTFFWWSIFEKTQGGHDHA